MMESDDIPEPSHLDTLVAFAIAFAMIAIVFVGGAYLL